jgi:riboflavin synthase
MFSGIIETVATVEEIQERSGNRTFLLSSSIADQFTIDQSVSHNGVCLTVEKILPEESKYQVTAIAETLKKSMLGDVKRGDRINLERSVGVNARFDGHFVQGHVDTTGTVHEIKLLEGSREIYIAFNPEFESLVVPQGSVSLNGISLTIASSDPKKHLISVAIIPYTIQATNIGDWKIGTRINIEFDVLGKYVQKMLDLRLKKE